MEETLTQKNLMPRLTAGLREEWMRMHKRGNGQGGHQNSHFAKRVVVQREGVCVCLLMFWCACVGV